MTDEFFDWDQLEQDMGEIDVSDVVNVRELTLDQLVEIIALSGEDLMNARQSIFPKEQWARDAHSLRSACLVEQQRRLNQKHQP